MRSNIFEERQAFNFYRSYYETSLLLDKENRAEFLHSILHYQFTGEVIEPKLPFALLAFNGQIHSLRKQVNGYVRGKETYPFGNPTKGKGKGSYKGKGKEVQEEEEVQVKVKEKEEYTKPRTVFTPPTLDEVISYFKEKGYTETAAKKAFEYYDVSGWKDGKGNQVKNWKQKMLSVWFKDENKDNSPKDIPGETPEERTRRLYVERMKSNPMKMTY